MSASPESNLSVWDHHEVMKIKRNQTIEMATLIFLNGLSPAKPETSVSSKLRYHGLATR
jgi:hypothetical protein